LYCTAEIGNDLEAVKMPDGMKQVKKKAVQDIQNQFRIHPKGISHLSD
jgi:hypothetical protein